MADKKRDILEFVEQSNFEQFTPTQKNIYLVVTRGYSTLIILCTKQKLSSDDN